MTTAIHSALPGADYFGSGHIDSPSYTKLVSLNTSLSHSEVQNGPTYTHAEYQRRYSASAPSSAPSSPVLTQSSYSQAPSYSSTPASSIALDGRSQFEEDEDEDDITFPSYEGSKPTQQLTDRPIPQATQDIPSSHPATPPPHDPSQPPKDDHAVVAEPTRHVDYLSHEWLEEDIWSSWSYIIHRRKVINNSTRLENASWRSWMKSKNRLRTISPESLNWLKDCDTTWLYGPLQTAGRRSLFHTTPPPSRLSHSSSFIGKKPILKKKSASAVMLERSLSQNTLLARAGEILRSQQSSPALMGKSITRRHTSDFNLGAFSGSSVANTPAEPDATIFPGSGPSFISPDPPTPNECRHVNFSNEVRQVQAIDSEDEDKEEEPKETVVEEDEDDDGGLMMAPMRTIRTSTPRGSFSNDNKTIMPLPSTTLKFRTDTPEPPEQPGLWPHGRTVSPTPSQETLRPSRPSHNFLIDDDPEVVDEPWRPREYDDHTRSPYEEEEEPSGSMRRTASGMFMPIDETEDEAAMNNQLFGRVMYGVNTIRDIAHVVWNVGWHRDRPQR